MRIKATIVAYVFSVQCFENATIVAYAGLRVKEVLTKYTSLKFNILLTHLLNRQCFSSIKMCQ